MLFYEVTLITFPRTYQFCETKVVAHLVTLFLKNIFGPNPRFLRKLILLLEVFQLSLNNSKLPIYTKRRPGLSDKQSSLFIFLMTSSPWQTISVLFVRAQPSAFLAMRVGLEVCWSMQFTAQYIGS